MRVAREVRAPGVCGGPCPHPTLPTHVLFITLFDNKSISHPFWCQDQLTISSGEERCFQITAEQGGPVPGADCPLDRSPPGDKGPPAAGLGLRRVFPL